LNEPLPNDMKIVSEKIYRIDDSRPSALVVHPGEEFVVKLQNAFGRSFRSVKDFETFFLPRNELLKKRVGHPCTGPIEVETKEKNISLAVHVVDTKVTKAYQCLSKSTGFLRDRFEARACEIYPIEPGNRVVVGGGDLRLRTHPKIGFVSTFDSESRSCGRASKNGGNLDLNFLDKGSIIYLPVNASKARFLIGDLHACQGNGEAAGIAIEADGEVTLCVEIVDKINFPIIDDKIRMIVVGYGETLEECARVATENSMIFLARIFPFCDWSEERIYKFISAEGNLVIGNGSGTIKTCGMVFYKGRMYNAHDLPIF